MSVRYIVQSFSCPLVCMLSICTQENYRLPATMVLENDPVQAFRYSAIGTLAKAGCLYFQFTNSFISCASNSLLFCLTIEKPKKFHYTVTKIFYI